MINNNLVAVITRQLSAGSPAVASAIILPPTQDDERQRIDDTEHYLKEKAEEHAKTFCRFFVEFYRAEWVVTILDTSANLPFPTTRSHETLKISRS